jgi:hypothetical protein
MKLAWRKSGHRRIMNPGNWSLNRFSFEAMGETDSSTMLEDE